jgi:hypothetical protein
MPVYAMDSLQAVPLRELMLNTLLSARKLWEVAAMFKPFRPNRISNFTSLSMVRTLLGCAIAQAV